MGSSFEFGLNFESANDASWAGCGGTEAVKLCVGKEQLSLHLEPLQPLAKGTLTSGAIS